MNSRMTIVKGRYFLDVLDQPAALSDTYRHLKRDPAAERARALIGSRSWNRIILTGMGASYHVLVPVAHDLLQAGISAIRIELSELNQCGVELCDDSSLLVIVSQSGESAEIHRLLSLAPRSPIVAVTNSPNSTLARAADAQLVTDAGVEFSVSCKTYLSALLALEWLRGALLGQGAERIEAAAAQVIAPVTEYLQSWESHVLALMGRMRATRHIFLMGRGRSLAAIGAGGLIVKEAARFPIEGMSSAAFRHGPMEMLSQDMLAIVMEGVGEWAPLNQSLLDTLRGQGNQGELLGPTAKFPPFRLPEAEPMHLPFLEILPVQMMTLALAALADREAGVFKHLTKVTSVE